jgi:hypothetical protein
VIARVILAIEPKDECLRNDVLVHCKVREALRYMTNIYADYLNIEIIKWIIT